MQNIPDNLTVVIAHNDDATRSQLREVIEGLSYQVKDGCCSVDDLIEVCAQADPDLIISSVELSDGNAIDALIDISNRNPTPAIIVTNRDSLLDVEKALRDHVMAYLVEPLDADQIRPTIYLVCERFRQFEALKQENEDLAQALSERKVIEKAKGLLIGRDELTEEQAFRRLQKMAQSARERMAVTAQRLLDQEAAE